MWASKWFEMNGYDEDIDLMHRNGTNRKRIQRLFNPLPRIRQMSRGSRLTAGVSEDTYVLITRLPNMLVGDLFCLPKCCCTALLLPGIVQSSALEAKLFECRSLSQELRSSSSSKITVFNPLNLDMWIDGW